MNPVAHPVPGGKVPPDTAWGLVSTTLATDLCICAPLSRNQAGIRSLSSTIRSSSLCDPTGGSTSGTSSPTGCLSSDVLSMGTS